MTDSVSLRPHDVSDFATRLLRALPELRSHLSIALGAGARAAAASSPAAAEALRASSGDLHQAVTGLDTSMLRLAAALQTAANDLIAQDAAMWGTRSVPLGARSVVPDPASADPGAQSVASGTRFVVPGTQWVVPGTRSALPGQSLVSGNRSVVGGGS